MNQKYSRQELFRPIGKKGQANIQEASVFIMGAGALGSASGEMLVRAGIGRVTIADRDIIEWSNLHRQQLYTEQDVLDQMPKAAAAQRRLSAINGDVEIVGIVEDVTPENIIQLITGHDFVVDGTDNMEIRLLMNDAALKLGIPFFMGACVGSYGLTYPIGVSEKAPCLHCLLETLPAQQETCDTAGVISPIVVTTAARQTAEVLKYLAGEAVPPLLRSTDLWTDQQSSINVGALRKESCPSCSSDPLYPYLHSRETMKAAVLCGRETVQLRYAESRKFDLEDFAHKIEGSVTKLVHNPHLAACEFQGHRIVLFKDGRMLVHGTNDIVTAKKLAGALTG